VMKTSLSSRLINFSVFFYIYYWPVAFWRWMLEERRPTWMPSQEAKTDMTSIKDQASQLQSQWQADPRWAGVQRTYTAEDVIKLRGSVQEEHTLARLGAERLWRLLQHEDYVNSLGALTGNQAVQQVRAGLKAIYLSGWQVAADAKLSGQTYPDQSLYAANSVPAVIRRINNALRRADQIDHHEGQNGTHWMAPIVADAEAGFGGCLNVFEL